MGNVELVQELRKIILNIDPEGIFFPNENNVDEYDPEIRQLISAVPNVKSEKDLELLIIEVFGKSFGEVSAKKNIEVYKQLSSEIWKTLQKNKA